MTALPHSLHGLAVSPVEDGSTTWTCECGHTGTAPDADAAIDGHRQHKAEATYLVRALAQSMRPADWFADNHEGNR